MIERINLLPEELKVVRKGPFYLFAVTSILIYIIILYSIYHGRAVNTSRLTAEKASLQQEISLLKTQDAKYKEILEKINITEARKKEVEEKVKLVTSISEGKIPWTDSLYELSNIIPQGVWLSSLSSIDTNIGDRKVKGMKLNGMALSSAIVADFMAAIDTSPYFEGAAMTYAQKMDYNKMEAFSFELTFRFRRGG